MGTQLSELSGRDTEASLGAVYVGIYWTLPVNWAGFRDLPPEVDAAAAASRTIRYQRERVQRYVKAEAGKLIDEIAFMETRTDRATDAVRDVLLRHAPALHTTRPTLLTVRFDAAQHWRPNPFIQHAADELGLRLMSLPPDAVVIDGQVFDPARHFAAWRRRDESAMARLRLAAEEGLRSALAATAAGSGRWSVVAEMLNADGTKTIRGGRWTPENVRKLASRISRA